MTRLLRTWAPALLILGLLAFMGWELSLWSARNGLPDGHQNEYLHVGNALDLWGAWVDRDAWHLRYYLGTNYWPPGFYLWPWPLFALLGATHQAMVLSNLGHLALLLMGAYLLGRELAGRRAGMVAVGLVALYPCVSGNLVRYEPNVPVAAWVTLGAWALIRARGFSERRASLLFGLIAGVGLLMDRLSLGVFLALPAAVEWGIGLRAAPPGERRGVLLGGLSAVGLVALVSGWWHLAFLRFHLDEILSQTDTGEIDSAGQLTEAAAARLDWLYYPLSLLDGQAGLFLGALGLLAVLVATGGLRERARRVPWLVVVLSTLLFTLVAKKQAFYTIPMLGCLAALSAEWLVSRRERDPWAPLRWAVLALLVVQGAHQHAYRYWGRGLPLPGVWAERLGGQLIPERWVQPRHPQSLPPGNRDLPVDALAASLGRSDVVVFSEDSDWYEGYLVLQLRERLPGARIKSVVGDPQGSYEWMGVAHAFVMVGEGGAPRWPSEAHLAEALVRNHYSLSELPPVVDAVLEVRGRFQLVAWWPLTGGRWVAAWRRE
ncbi:MAG: glycosyltransferase family 39 protein [Alphaproteobacteria bacterium]|nr:glycosyltransferase family 39 protein [Alphaproteobacteria bacterium]MCB9793483.1 glycosyltransferase family 39 protein [Alphaproteobacteria bacterium]